MTPTREAMRLAVLRAEDERRADDPMLRRALGETDPALRARAARACGRIQDSTLVPRLTPLLRDPAAEVRQEAAFALGQIGNAAAREPLEASLKAGDPDLTDLAIEALGKLGDRAATPRVAAYLTDPSPRLRGEAAVALWRLADSTALGALLARHDDPDPEVRWRVLYALEKIVRPDRVVLVTALHLNDDDWRVRAYAARTLGRQKSPRATAYLIDRLSDPEPAVVVNALRALQAIADSTCGACAGPLLRALSAPYPYVRVTAATLLAERFPYVAAGPTQREALLDSVAAHLRDPDAATRGACARALLAQRGPAALAAVRPVLEDTSVYARVAVVQALGHLDSTSALPLLLARLTPAYPLFDRMSAAEAIGTLHAVSAEGVLRAGLADSSVFFVASCVGALGDLGVRGAIPELAAAYAARGAEADPDARLAIRDALRALAGRPFADSLERAHGTHDVARPLTDAELLAAPDARGAILHTGKGDIEWAFENAEAPQTVKIFVRLARLGYFDGLAIHRVVPNFVIQDGDPTGTGSGGPGYTIRCEYNRLRYETAGMVGMALSGKDTGGSQWFITHSPQHHLDGRYTIFAHVVRGMDVVNRIVQGDRVVKVEVLK